MAFTAGQMKAFDVFLNFPMMDMNMNVFWKNPEGVDEADIARMNAFWGDESWRNVAYEEERTLFGPVEKKAANETVAEAFRQRLRDVAGFANVPAPMPMRNSSGLHDTKDVAFGILRIGQPTYSGDWHLCHRHDAALGEMERGQHE